MPTVNNNIIFTGNPGTCKTTVAKLVAQMYRALGAVGKGQLVEVYRPDFVGIYEGQSAIKTAKVVDSAIGGVLYVGDMYRVCRRSNDPFGAEAVSTLKRLMRERRGEFFVIISGLPDEMEEFLKANHEFGTMFANRIAFEDYTKDELLKIFQLFCKKNGYVFAEETHSKIESLFNDIYKDKSDIFANSHIVYSLLEDILIKHSVRLRESGELTEFSDEELMTIHASDFPDYYR